MQDDQTQPASRKAAGLSLAELRQEIDRVDDALIALMDQRLSRSVEVARIKRDGDLGGLCLRPRREAEILERLVRQTERLPHRTIRAIWRELMALSLHGQRRTSLILHSPVQPVLVTNLTRLRFGCVAPIIVVGSPLDALRRARAEDAIAVIELAPLSSWWVELHDDPQLRIFDALSQEPGRACALAIGRLADEDLVPDERFRVLTVTALRREAEAGATIRPLAISGHMRLCQIATAGS